MEPEKETERPRGLIGAVDNVLRLLRFFEDRELLRVNQVAREMDLSRSTVHRMLTTLAHHHYVEQDEHSRGYRAGPALVDIGLAVVQNMDIRARSYGVLVRLRDATGETVHLGTRRGAEVLFVESVESERTLKTSSRVGWTLPAHATAAGKALLAELTDPELAALYPGGVLRASTGDTIGSLDSLRAELAEVRERGFAVNRGESETDVGGVGVAVKDLQGHVRAGIAVTGPLSRVDDEWIAKVAAATMRAGEELGGYMV